MEGLPRRVASVPRRSKAQRGRGQRSGAGGWRITTDQLIDLAVALFADASARGDVQLANDAAGIALDLTAQVRFAVSLLEAAEAP